MTASEDLGGDPVCWLDRVCPECGLFLDDPDAPCPRCGHHPTGRPGDDSPGNGSPSGDPTDGGAALP